MSQKDAILTVCHRMPFWKVEAFVKSLRQTGYSGRVICFASLLSRTSEKRLRDYGIEIEHFLFLARHVRQRLAQPWNLWRRFFSLPQPEWIRDLIAKRVLHLFYLRHLLYLRFLEDNPKIERVLMCDSRDVYFQLDPFSGWPGTGLHAFEEEGTTLIGDCPHHRRWIRHLHGDETLLRLASKPRVCAGTILADRESAIGFLNRMVEMTYSALSLEPHDGDQGLFNILIHENLLPFTHVYPNGVSSVATLGGGDHEKIRINTDGFVVAESGAIIPILHQYDRCPALTKTLLAKIGLQVCPSSP